MCEVKEPCVFDFHTGGTYTTLNSNRGILASDQGTFEDHGFNTKDLRTTLTESGKKTSLDELAELVVTVAPDFEPLTKKDLDSIKERSAEIGAINAHLDSMNKLLAEMEKNLDDGFKKFDSIKERF